MKIHRHTAIAKWYYARLSRFRVSSQEELPQLRKLPGFADPDVGSHTPKILPHMSTMQLVHEANVIGHRGCVLSNPSRQCFGTRRPVRHQVTCSKGGGSHQTSAALPSLTKRESCCSWQHPCLWSLCTCPSWGPAWLPEGDIALKPTLSGHHSGMSNCTDCTLCGFACRTCGASGR